jgi:hypothetical protein
MERIGRLLYHWTYDKVAYEPIREDFLRWYGELFETVNEDASSENSRIMEMTMEARTEAREYEPSSPAHTAIDVVDGVKETITFITAWASILGLGAFLALLSIDSFSIIPSRLPYQWVLIDIVTAVAFIATLVYPIYIIISRILLADEELVRQYNRELSLSLGEIRDNERYQNNLTAIYIWHSSLCSTTKQPIIVVLGTIRTISPRAYGYISYRISENMKSHFEESLREKLRREYQLYKQKTKEREPITPE